MKETLILFILLFCAHFSQTLDQEVLSNEIKENSLLLPQFSWIDPHSIQVTYPGRGKDKLNLRSFGRLADINVPCLFNGIFEKDIWGSAMVSGCINDSSVYLTIYSYHLPGKTSFIWNQAGVIDVVNPYSFSENGTENYMGNSLKDGQMERDAKKRVKRGTFSDDYYEDEYYEEEYYEEYYEASFDGPSPIPSDLILQVKLGYEESLLQQMNGNHSASKEYCAEVAAHGSIHLRHSSLGTRIHLEFIGAPQFLSGKTLNVDRQSLQQVQFAKKDSVPLIVFVKKDDTNQTAMGVAYPGRKGGACDAVNSAAILKWRSNPLKAAITFAHENGHLTGQLHDEREDERSGGKTSCEGTGIMSKGDARIERPVQWSECSARRFKKWFPRKGKCLVTAPSCDNGDQWKTPCTCGSGNASMACLSSHSYCWKKYFGDSPYQCLTSVDLEKALSTPQRGEANTLEEWEKMVEVLQQELNMLKTKFESNEVKMKMIETKTENIETKTKFIETKTENIETKTENIETRTKNMETKTEKIEKIEADTETLKANMNEKNGNNTEDRLSYLEDMIKLNVIRSCQEMLDFGIKTSNYYHIDPDGPLTGSQPFRVWCDFSENGRAITEVLHNSEQAIEVEKCELPGCYKHDIVYTAPDDQIQALIQLSENCQQTVRYDCLMAPLMDDGINFGFWNDRQGDAQYYWEGSHSGEHLCSCFYQPEGCLQKNIHNTTCNCDAGVPEMKMDFGTITDKTALPISSVQFGGLVYDLQQASHTLGRLQCWGKSTFEEGTSCASLKRSGQFNNGFYNIRENDDEHTQLVFCNMTTSPGYEDNSGQTYIESSETHFDQVEEDIAKIGQDVTKINQDIGQVNKDIGKINEDLTKIGQDVTKNNKDIGQVNKDIGQNNQDLTKIGQDVTKNNKDIGKVNKDIGQINEDMDKIGQDVTKNNKDIGKVNKDIGQINEDMETIKSEIAMHSSFCGYQDYVSSTRNITYDSLLFEANNIPGAFFNLGSGRYTAGVTGTYRVDLAIGYMYSSNSNFNRIYIQHNGANIAESEIQNYIRTSSDSGESGGRSLVLHLEKGDYVSVSGSIVYKLYYITFCVSYVSA